MASLSTPVKVAARPRARRLGRMPILITLALLAGLGWWGWVKTHANNDPTANMLTATVARGDLVQTIQATGSVNAQTGAEVHIGSQITGTIQHLYADVGSFVKAGQLIAQLDLPDIQDQLKQSQANLDAAQTKLAQTLSGVGMERTQTSQAVLQARAAVRSAQAQLAADQAASSQQTAQTPTDIARAKNAISVAAAALKSAIATQVQTKAGADLQVANANEQLGQATANAKNSALNLSRQQQLLSKGYVAQSVVDAAAATDAVYQSQVRAAQQNVSLIQQKVTADLATAQDVVDQAQQNVAAAQSALVSAQAESYSDTAKQATVNSARAAVNQALANLQTAIGNTAQDVLKQQDVVEAREAVRVAQAQVAYNQAQVNKTFIRTPISGTVLQLAAQQGETLAAGLSAPTVIVVADLTRLQVDAYVDETDIGKVRLGQEADVTVDAFPKRVFKGKVVKIASGSTIQQSVVTYDVTVALNKTPRRPRQPGAPGRPGASGQPGAPGRPGASGRPDMASSLKPDMTANVTIQTGVQNNVILVPTEAVKIGVRGSTVNVVSTQAGKKVVEVRKVKTGGSDGTNTEITQGLKEGEVIVVAGYTPGGGAQRGAGPTSPFGPSRGGGGGGGRGGGGGGRGG